MRLHFSIGANSLSSGLELMQAGTDFPKVRRMLLFHAPLFWTASTLLRGHLALATLSPDEVHLSKHIRAKDFGLEVWCDVQYPL